MSIAKAKEFSSASTCSRTNLLLASGRFTTCNSIPVALASSLVSTKPWAVHLFYMFAYTNAFISYQTDDAQFASKIRAALGDAGISAFLAHENIEVSEVWRTRLLEELHLCDVFVAVLSKRYLESLWCLQESGIAAFKQNLLVIPLSLDGSNPPAFLSSFQAASFDDTISSSAKLAKAYTKRDLLRGIKNQITLIESSHSWRNAEENFDVLAPNIPKMTVAQANRLLTVVDKNKEVSHATKCAKVFIPAVLKSFPQAGSAELRASLEEKCRNFS